MVGLGAMGVGLAHWTDTLTIGGTVETGSWMQSGTAYAYGGEHATCFSDIDTIRNAPWGWSNGPLPPGSYVFDMYAGAGGCDPNHGTLVGTLTVNYGGSTVAVTYDMFDDSAMTATHLYVGTEPLPRKKNGKYTTAPGQYTDIHDPLDNETTDSYLVSGFNREAIYVVAHAVVTWFEPSPP